MYTDGSAWRRTALWSIVAVAVWMIFSTAALADLRIVMDEEGETIEYVMKNGKVAIPQTDGSRFIIDCSSGEITIISSVSERTYWRGTVPQLVDDVQAMTDEVMAMFADEVPAELFDMFADMTSGGGVPDAVRTTRVGTETVAGYDAVHYKVEYELDGTWQTMEDVWLSDELLRHVEAEIGHCMSTMMQDVMQALTSFIPKDMGLGVDAMAYVVASPEYQALFEIGYPVRNRSIELLFGMRFETITELTQVSHEPVSDDLFTVPQGYARVDRIRDFGGM